MIAAVACAVAGIWTGIGLLVALAVGPLLRRNSEHYPPTTAA